MLETLTMLGQGGWVMVPIGVCSLAGLAIVLERMVALRRTSVIDPRVVRLIDEFGSGITPESALMVCRRSHGVFARIIEDVLNARHLDREQNTETMHAAGRAKVGALERGLTLLEVIANVSPLLGLLGTVLGMVNVFDVITAKGIGNPQVLSGGISKALITTIAGLSVAIPAVAFHSWLSRRVEDYAVEMHERATVFIMKLYGAGAASKGR